MKRGIVLLCCLSLFFIGGSLLRAQYAINERIEAEDLYDGRVLCGGGVDWLRVCHGEGWANHPSDFIYAMCGNMHWLCDYRTIYRCQYSCADVYVSAEITIPETGDYVIYAYVANWADSAVIESNAGCNREDKWECDGWFLVWDDPIKLDKVMDVGGEMNVYFEGDYWPFLWATHPHDTYCGQFGLDTVTVGKNRMYCPNEDPRGCDFPGTRFHLTAGKHTLHLKVAAEYTLLDWLWVAKDGDAPPDAIPGRSWGETNVESRTVHRPESFTLMQNYPNPFNPETTIEYYLPVRAKVNLSIYNISGHKVADIIDAIQSPGQRSINFNAGGLPSGPYFYKLMVTCASCTGREKTLFSEVKEMQFVK